MPEAQCSFALRNCASAEEDEILHRCRAAVFPVLDVVSFGPPGWALASGEPAVLVSGGEGSLHGGGDGSDCSAVVEDAGVGCVDEAFYVGVAGDPVDGATRENCSPVGSPRLEPGDLLVLVEVDEDGG